MAGRVQGSRLDAPLTEVGLRQALDLGKRLAAECITAVYTSPLLRARETAIAIASEARLPVLGPLPGLTEFSWGDLDGRLRADVETQINALEGRWRAGELDATPPGGESLKAAHARAHAEVVRVAQRHPGERVVLVTHAGIARILVAGARGDLSELGDALLPATFTTLPVATAPQRS